MRFNRTQLYLIKIFENDLSDSEFEKLKNVVNKYFHFIENQSTNNITNQNNLSINKEPLDQLSIQLTKAYFKLSFEFPTHHHVKDWIEKEKEWREYRISLNKMHFKDVDEINQEINRVSNLYKEVQKIINDLKK